MWIIHGHDIHCLILSAGLIGGCVYINRLDLFMGMTFKNRRAYTRAHTHITNHTPHACAHTKNTHTRVCICTHTNTRTHACANTHIQARTHTFLSILKESYLYLTKTVRTLKSSPRLTEYHLRRRLTAQKGKH